MPNIVALVSDNILKLTLFFKDTTLCSTTELPSDIVSNSDIIDTDGFANIFLTAFKTLKGDSKISPDVMFLIDPDNVLTKFITFPKANISENDVIIEEIEKKLGGLNLDDVYYSYQKIAPFVYQFVGVKKDLMATYVDIANKIGLSVSAVVPWLLLLPKYLNSNDPCIFIAKDVNKEFIALSELNGIYFSEAFDPNKNTDQIQKTIEELSVYKRANPIKKIYTLTDRSLEFDKDYDVSELLVLNEDFSDKRGYELNLLAMEVLSKYPDYLVTQINLLTLLPKLTPIKSSRALVYVGSFVGAFMLIFGGFFAYTQLRQSSSNSKQIAQSEPPTVLSEQTQPDEPAPTQEELKPELNKQDIKIRVENGAGIAGIAAQTQDMLIEKGYDVISIGNADESGRENTLISMKPSKLDYKDMLEEDLINDFKLEINDNLSEDLEYDVLITVGLN